MTVKTYIFAWPGLAGAASCQWNILISHDFVSSKAALPHTWLMFASSHLLLSPEQSRGGTAFSKLLTYLHFTCMSACLCICVHTTLIQCPQKPEEDAGSPRSEVSGVCEPLFGCWKLNVGHLKEQQVFLASKPCPHHWVLRATP